MKIAIIGAGIAGLTAAYDLARAGQQVVVYEAAPVVGGLASGFRDPRWEWSLERFYHHIFETDSAMRKLVHAIGFRERLFFRKATTAQWWQGRFYPVDSPLRLLRFRALPLPDRLRLGMVLAYLKYITSDWYSLERTTASAWAQRWMGQPAYTTFVKPLLEGKFGPYVSEVNMAWLWARFRARSFKLGYFVGGFQAFADALLAAVERLGVTVHMSTPVNRVETYTSGWALWSDGTSHNYDALIVTGSPRLLSRLAPQLPTAYLNHLLKLRSMGAVVLTIALKQRLTSGLYWMQGFPKTLFPFLALVEHTNFIAPAHYGGDHLIYCGDYLPPDHEYFRLSHEELLARFLPALHHANPDFTPAWVRASWLHREPYAQPIVGINHSQNIPPLATPLRGLYWASMSQVYPWDRGTNFAVELGQRVAAEVLQSAPR